MTSENCIYYEWEKSARQFVELKREGVSVPLQLRMLNLTFSLAEILPAPSSALY